MDDVMDALVAGLPGVMVSTAEAAATTTAMTSA